MISQRVRYALKAMLSLAAASPGDSVMIGTIAKDQQIPESFLAIILLELKRCGLVQSRRGREGGYLLARSAADITFGQILRSIEGPLALMPCVSRTQYRRCADCVDESACALHKVLVQVRESTAAILDNHTLQDAVDGVSGAKPRARHARGIDFAALTGASAPKRRARRTETRSPKASPRRPAGK